MTNHPPQRSAQRQSATDIRTARLTLYHFPACPYCVCVAREIERLTLKIEMRDILCNDDYFEELRAGGGRTRVPCLRICDDDGASDWLYESAEIISYLRTHFAD
jgi:glutathione S-transferase